jgi:hypothetical protein
VPRLTLPFSLPPAVPQVVTTRHRLFVSCRARQSHPEGIKSSSSGHGKRGRGYELADGDDEVDGNGLLEGSEEARASIARPPAALGSCVFPCVLPAEAEGLG